MGITHSFTSPKSDGGDATLVRPSDWNDTHDFDLGKNSIETDAGDIQLVGDAAAPGNDKVYGTDGAGAKGWKDDPAGGGLAGTLKTDGASVNSATPGTLVAEIEAASGKKFIFINGQAGITSAAANRQVKVIVTHTDDTTTEVTTNNNTQERFIVNDAGLTRTKDGGIWTINVFDKDTKKIRAETAGTATGVRSAMLAAFEVDI